MPKILERSRLLAARPKNPQRANMLPNIPMEWKIPTYGKQYENSRLEGRSSPQPVNVSARATHWYTWGHSHRFSCRVRVVNDRVKKGEPPFGSLFLSSQRQIAQPAWSFDHKVWNTPVPEFIHAGTTIRSPEILKAKSKIYQVRLMKHQSFLFESSHNLKACSDYTIRKSSLIWVHHYYLDSCRWKQ